MRKYGYAQEKLWEAVHSLVGDGSIGDRLGYARDTLLRLRPGGGVAAERGRPGGLRQGLHTDISAIRRHTRKACLNDTARRI